MADPIAMVRLTARRIGPQSGDLTKPKVYNVLASDIKNLRSDGAGGAVFEDAGASRIKGQRKIQVYENPSQIRQNINLLQGVSTGLLDTDFDLAVSAAGSVLTAATDLTKHFNKITHLTTGSADGVQLPAPAAIGDVVIILNTVAASADVFPHTASAFIDTGASGVPKGVLPGKAVHFVAKSTGNTGVWHSALDEYNSW